MRHKKKIPVGTIVVTLVVILGFGISEWGFQKANKEAILGRNMEFLKESTEHCAGGVSDVQQGRLRLVENLAVMLERFSQNDPLQIADVLSVIEKNSTMDELYFVTVDGLRYYPDGKTEDLQTSVFFQSGVKGESGITGLSGFDMKTDKQHIACYAPVMFDGEVCGVIVGCNFYNSFSDLYMVECTDEYVFRYLIDKSGKILLPSEEGEAGNLFAFLESSMSADDYERLMTDFRDSGTGYGIYRGDYGEGLACFWALGINDWYVLEFFTSERTASLVAPLNASASFLETMMLFNLLLAVGYTLYLTYGRYNQKNRLMESALEALEDTFPRIACVNFRTGKCLFVKDREKKQSDYFKDYTLADYRENFLKRVYPEDFEKCKSFISGENMRRIREQGLVSDTCIYRGKYEGEYQWTQTVIIPAADREDCVLMYARMVDESVKSEEFYKEQLWKAMQRAKEAEAVKGRFLQYVSYDFKTSIRAIHGMSVMAAEAVERRDAEEVKHRLNCVNNLGDYLQTMLNDILQISVEQEQHLRRQKRIFSVKRLMNGCGESCHFFDVVNRDIQFEVACDERLREWYVGDQLRIIQILNVLFSNACKFEKTGGRVTLKAALEEAGEKTDRISFAVSDTGKGISEEMQQSIRELFAKKDGISEESMARTGLGLVLAKLALDSVGGQIRLESALGEGSRFTVYLELEHAPEYGEEKPFRVLVVDDNPLNLEMAVELLKMDEYEAVGCECGKKALQVFLDSEPGYFQALLTDVKMPEMDGAALAERVRKSGRSDSESIFIAALSAKLDAEEIARLKECGVEAILEKPVRVTQFVKSLGKREKRETL